MRLLAAALALAAVPALAAAPSASAATTSHPVTASASTSATALQRAAIAQTAQSYAAAAPRLSWQQKAKNADHLARAMQMPGISTSERAIAIGKTQIGTMYRWGGTTPAGFDCSGLTSYAYRKAGKTLPRTAAAQQRAARKVSNPVPGDLVFYGAPAHHVGIYLGDGKMLHAPRTGKPIQIVTVYGSPTFGRP